MLFYWKIALLQDARCPRPRGLFLNNSFVQLAASKGRFLLLSCAIRVYSLPLAQIIYSEQPQANAHDGLRHPDFQKLQRPDPSHSMNLRLLQQLKPQKICQYVCAGAKLPVWIRPCMVLALISIGRSKAFLPGQVKGAGLSVSGCPPGLSCGQA